MVGAGALLTPGFFENGPVRAALGVSFCAAMLSAMVGVFTIIRGQSFAGHALADVSSAGGAGAFLFGVNPLFGFLGLAVLGAGVLEMVGVQRARERDLATGVFLGAGLGVTALLLYFDVTMRSTSGAAISVMFGSMFAIPPGMVKLSLGLGAGAMVVMAMIHRPLLLCAAAPELAGVQGVNVRLIGFLHLLMLALAVTLSAMTIGAILSTALLIGPAAAALRLARRPGRAIGLAVVIGVAACWGGVWLAYDSYNWSGGHGWPVSFFIVTIIFTIYLASGLRRDRTMRV
ncbi:MAG: metal ABC transporter permease [Acidocella sp.]|nr:metal ABC transporter permease [Acidocella sp.]